MALGNQKQSTEDILKSMTTRGVNFEKRAKVLGPIFACLILFFILYGCFSAAGDIMYHMRYKKMIQADTQNGKH